MFRLLLQPRETAVKLVFSDKQAQSPAASAIFVVNGTYGNDGGVEELIGLMQTPWTIFLRQKQLVRDYRQG